MRRRRSLQTLAASATAATGAIAFSGCQPPLREFQMQSRVRLAEDILSAYENWYATTCRRCPAGCGLIIRVIEGRAKKAEGNPDHPVNRGKLCARGQAVVQEQYHPDRLQGPLRRAGERGSGKWSSISWDGALEEVIERLRDLHVQGRGGEVALITPPLRGHQGVLVERFAGAYGAQWLVLDLLGEAPLRAAVRQVLGQDVLPQFDVQGARYLLSFGADFLHTWLSPVHYGVQYGVFRQGSYRAEGFAPRAERPRGYLVQVEPRFSGTAASADEWVYVRPGAELLLALSIAQVLLSEGLADLGAARAFGDTGILAAYRPERVAGEAGVAPERVRQLARDLAAGRPSLVLAGGPAGSQTSGTETVAAILALNGLVGAIGARGGVRFNPPPLVGAGRGLRAARLDEWQQLAERLRAGQVQAVLAYGADPVHQLPASTGFREALSRAPFVASFASFADDTTMLADVVLPFHLPLEDWGDDAPDPAPGVQVVSVQQPVVPPAYDTRSFWDVLLALAEEIGGAVRDALPWASFRDALRDGARTWQGLGRGSVQERDLERFWVRLLQRGGWWEDGPPAEDRGETVEAGRAVAQAMAQLRAIAGSAPRPRYSGASPEFPYHLVLYAHHTLGTGEGAHLPWLQATPDPVTTAVWTTWVEVNPRRARELSLREGDIVRVESPHGRVEAPVYVHPAAPPEVIAMPLGQGHRAAGRWARGRGANPLDLLAPLADDATGALAYAATRVRLNKTGRRVRLPKLEGDVPAYELPGQRIIKVTRAG
jgi:anaerobic selenocysteine-containing dehydrogenase